MTIAPRPLGATTAGGWGWKHQQARQVAARKVATGGVKCSRCGYPIYPGEPWDLDHADGIDKRLGVYRGPSHSHCNRAAGARNGRPRKWTRKGAATPPAPKPKALNYFDVPKTRTRTTTFST